MTFFYELNKRLTDIADKPVTQKLNERDMSRHAKGIEKYGKEGMQALAKAGRQGKDLDKIRDKYNKYDDSVEEGLGSIVKTIGGGIKKAATKAMDVVAPGDEKLLKNLQRDVGVPQTGRKPGRHSPMHQDSMPHNFGGGVGYGDGGMTEEYGPLEEKPMTPKQKSFAKLAPPTDKVTFADKIAGAKKEVDEMLGDVAAEAMRGALRGGQKKLDKNQNGKLDAQDFAMLRKGGKQETDEGWDDMIKAVDQRRSEVKAGHKVQGAKGEIEKTATGIKHTRRYDAKTGETDTGDDAPAQGEKRGRGRPKGTGKSMGAKGPSGKSKLMTKEADHDSEEIKQAMAVLKKAGYKVEKAEQELDEKAVSKKQQRFMGMVHATQKGEKAPSKEVAKVAKSMGKKDAEDFAATKHKGLPEKKAKKKEEVEETTVAGNVAPAAAPKASKGGMTFGKGIYDSMNRELEQMIAESMNISMSMNNDMHGGPSKSLTVTATDEDAMMLGKLLKMAGVGSDADAGSCGSPAEQVDENQPDWPTDAEQSNDALQYSGGLNKPKITVAGDGQTTVPVTAVQVREEDLGEQEQVMAPESEELDETLRRIKEMAGIKTEAKKVEEDDVEEGNKFTGNLAKARAAGKDEADLDGDGDLEKVKESVNKLWRVYKG